MFDESVATQLFPGTDISSFLNVMSGPGRALIHILFSAAETALASAVAFATEPGNAPLIGLRVLNERIADPITFVNMMVQQAAKSGVPVP